MHDGNTEDNQLPTGKHSVRLVGRTRETGNLIDLAGIKAGTVTDKIIQLHDICGLTWRNRST